jgi:hypothetical protein
VEEADFLSLALESYGGVWSKSLLHQLSTKSVPDSLFGRRKSFVKADVFTQWAYWFVRGVADPSFYVDRKVPYPFILTDISRQIDLTFTTLTYGEKQTLAALLSQCVLSLVLIKQATRRRAPVSIQTKQLLLDLGSSPPRCWVCGAEFTSGAIDAFLGYKEYQYGEPFFVDIYKPRGLNRRDFCIEVDHVIPFANGGENADNLRLACGWCNRHKSNLVAVYEVSGRVFEAAKNHFGIPSLPNPFWVVRLLATHKQCEHPGGCNNTVIDSELTVLKSSNSGEPNPLNLRLTCREHDEWQHKRYIPIEAAKAIWLKHK